MIIPDSFLDRYDLISLEEKNQVYSVCFLLSKFSPEHDPLENFRLFPSSQSYSSYLGPSFINTNNKKQLTLYFPPPYEVNNMGHISPLFSAKYMSMYFLIITAFLLIVFPRTSRIFPFA